jgi:competence protein ComEC
MKLRVGYVISGTITALILLFSFVWTQPDGRLHVIFCDVGQGDGAYIQFPDGRDMVVDGGPNDRIVDCLGRHMPFWDRKIDMVVLTHPQKDHMQGLITVLDRYQVDYFVRSDIVNTTEGYAKLMDVVYRKNIEQKFVTQGQTIQVDNTSLSFLWPTDAQISKGAPASVMTRSGVGSSDVLGASVGDLNDYSLVFGLRYGSFDVIFTGDADTRVDSQYTGLRLADDSIEVLKVPHHGSKTGMSESFVNWVRPQLAVISVGKNNYGHPTKDAINMLQSIGASIMRTDESGDIAVISDGTNWQVVE